MADYRIVPVALDNGGDKQQVVEANVSITNVTVIALAPGASLSLHFGQRAGIPVQQGFEFSDERGCPIENDGLFATFPAQPGVTAQLYVGAGVRGVGVST